MVLVAISSRSALDVWLHFPLARVAPCFGMKRSFCAIPYFGESSAGLIVSTLGLENAGGSARKSGSQS